MVARVFWRSDEFGAVPWLLPCTSLELVQERSLGTTLSASDLHNAGQQFLIPDI